MTSIKPESGHSKLPSTEESSTTWKAFSTPAILYAVVGLGLFASADCLGTVAWVRYAIGWFEPSLPAMRTAERIALAANRNPFRRELIALYAMLGFMVNLFE